MQMLERSSDIAKAQSQFATEICALASESIEVTIGFQSGDVDRKVAWLPSLGIWALFDVEPPLEKSPGPRYWNVFGVGKPKPHGLISIDCEINPPKRGINRQVGGAFVVEPPGKTAVVHRGMFNAGGRVPLEFTRNNFNWDWTLVIDGDKRTEVMVIGMLGEPNLALHLRQFVTQVKEFKEAARSRPWL